MMRNNIKDKIVESGYTQNHIAKVLGVHFSDISQRVSGRRKPNRDRTKALAKLLKCKISDLSLEN